MITLGIETSCDETAIAIIKDRRILSSVVSSSMHLHRRYGGVVPEIATRYHVEVINYCLKEALKESRLDLKGIDLISVTQGPGLIGALLIGISYAKALSFSLNCPVIGVNHVIAHLWANYLTDSRPPLPFIGLVISGGHTSLFEVKAPDKYRLLGQTQDDAAGEAFDKVAKILGLGYPGGPIIEKSAAQWDFSDWPVFSIPSAMDGRLLDFSFSGIKTAVLYHVRAKGGPEKLKKKQISGIARGFQEAVCDALTAKAVSACSAAGIKNLAIGGGVSANMTLRRKLAGAARLNGLKLFIPSPALCLDNGAGPAILGNSLFKKGIRSSEYMSGFADFEKRS
ncbi:MAG: tRNA (adenosine(37)-N6)-threonylcarbamoyltransferase complex transferase subunit TsaD [Candidatus Omnitrophica bacterium]|nr:tRNA (adenosine(37)-N6)-threonylcarbamoyltransferase complex transferase subunit TsaD [Candidatus Omnitrophota bacterium]